MADDPMADAAAEFAEQLRQLDVEQYLVMTCSTLASVAYGKLDAGDLAQARAAIDALAALTPLVGEAIRKDLQAALASLQVAFANATAQPRG